jgi:hypothetical protein
MLIETLLQPNDTYVISHVFVRNHITFFKLRNESFCTAAGHVYHQSSTMFDSPPLKIWAHEAHTNDGQERHANEIQEINKQLDLWMKHKRQVYRMLLVKACEMMVQNGEEEMEKFIEFSFDITPSVGALQIIKQLEE